MGKDTRRFLVLAHGADVRAVQVALGLLTGWCEDAAMPRRAVLLIPARGNLDGTTLGEALGTQVSKMLLDKKNVRLPKGSTLKLETMQTFHSYAPCDVVLAVYASPKMLEQVDDCNAEAVIVVPWLEEDVTEWCRVWNPHIVGVQNVQEARGGTCIEVQIATPSVPERVPANLVVEEGLKMLASLVNVSTGLSHPLDKPKAVALFRLLLKHREAFEASEVRAWALRNGWSTRGADQLGDVAQAVLDGKRIQGARDTVYKADVIKRLRERVIQESGEQP